MDRGIILNQGLGVSGGDIPCLHAGTGTIEPRARTEVKKAYWLMVQDVDQVSWRFPGQGEILRELLIKHKEESRP